MKPSLYDHVLVHYDPPPKDIRTSEDIVVFFIKKSGVTSDDRHLTDMPGVFQACPLKLKPGERAFVLEFRLTQSQNDYTNLVTFDVDPFFDCDVDVGDEQQNHYKRHHTRIGIVANYSGKLNDDASLLYKPTVSDLGMPVIPYIGQEGHIMSARSTCIGINGIADDSFQIYHHSDPFVAFVLAHANRFEDLKSDDIKKVDNTKYVISRKLVEYVKNLFRLAIFPLIRYTTKDHIRFRFKDPPQKTTFKNPLIIMCLKLTYIVVKIDIPTYTLTRTEIKV